MWFQEDLEKNKAENRYHTCTVMSTRQEVNLTYIRLDSASFRALQGKIPKEHNEVVQEFICTRLQSWLEGGTTNRWKI